MAKAKTIYSCQKCDAQASKWQGQCPECGAWNSLVEETYAAPKNRDNNKVTTLDNINLTTQSRLTTNIKELDRVLGGGLVMGSVVLVGGNPGIGKSTLLLQTVGNLSQNHQVLYVTGEESLQQIALRAKRLNLPQTNLKLLTETNAEQIIANAKKEQPKILVVDSIQTIYSDLLQSAPGSVSQVRESAAQLVRFAKQTNTALFLIGHVTKEGTLAGPRVLEHMVDSVLYFEGGRDDRYRVVRAIKNRFGAVNELGVFAMTDAGLREVTNPSAIFLSRTETPAAGSVVMSTWEGTRPLLIEIQALVDKSYLENPRRVALGLEYNRLAMLLAVLQHHAKIPTYNQDVFINVVGGIKVTETAADLALLLAVVSSLRNKPLPHDLLVFGEVGLSGEIRPVQNGQERLKEAVKHGFTQAIIPKANAPKKTIAGMQVTAVNNLSQCLSGYFSKC